MAVDTPAKRFSMLDWGSGAGLMLPDGAIAQADRQHLLDLYSGILASELVVVNPSPRGLRFDITETRFALPIEKRFTITEKRFAISEDA